MIDGLRIMAVIVMYRRRIEQVAALPLLRSSGDGPPSKQVWFVDNSSREESTWNANACRTQGFRHLAMAGNRGLSVAYNAACTAISAEIEDPARTYVVLLDQDTVLPRTFWSDLRGVLTGGAPTVVVAPHVRDARGLLSPCRSWGYGCCRLKVKPDKTPMNEAQKKRSLGGNKPLTEDSYGGHDWQPRYSAINSGLAVRLDYLLANPYPESLFLDFIDHLFFRRVQRSGAAVALSPAVLTQEFSGSDRDKNRQLRRFAIYSRDYLQYCRLAGLSVIIGKTMLLLRAVRLALRHGSVGFLRAAWHSRNTSAHPGEAQA